MINDPRNLKKEDIDGFIYWLRTEKANPPFQIWDIERLTWWTKRTCRKHGINIGAIQAITLKNKVYCRSYDYYDRLGEHGQLEKLCLIAHEWWHIEQIRFVGWKRFRRAYLLDRSARIYWETGAYQTSISAAYMTGHTLNHGRMARELKSLYLATDRQADEAYEAFEQTLEWLIQGRPNPVQGLWDECYQRAGREV